MKPGELGRWWKEGARSALFLRPRWNGLEASPAIALCLLAALLLLALVIERLYVVGAARPYWQALFMGWFSSTATAWLCWLATSHGTDDGAPAVRRPGAADLFCMLNAQTAPQVVVLGAVFVPLVQAGWFTNDTAGSLAGLVAIALPTAWQAGTSATLVWRSAAGRAGARLGSTLIVAALPFLALWVQAPRMWYPDLSASTAASVDRRLELTPELIDDQQKAAAAGLRELAAERPGTVDVYALTYAPYAGEDVFRNESALVARLMEERFGAEGRTLQLVNHVATAHTLTWATPLNLRRAIQRVGERMNRDEDILFIHLASHGGSDGRLSTSFRPLTLEPVTPAMLKGWLDEAGIRWRVISVSACYAGGWIEPLADDRSLVMTAADADHTSFGCGHQSELTYFGRAMFDEQLRSTWSFEDAHAAAREVIRRREIDAGKSDGYSNPQIKVGTGMRSQLARLASERAASAVR